MDKGVINMTLGEWIKNYRDKHSLSMQEMADMCGFSKAYIGQLEKELTRQQVSLFPQRFKHLTKLHKPSV